jgi:hypothetical protein
MCFGWSRIVGDGSWRELREKSLDPSGQLAALRVTGIPTEDCLDIATRLVELGPQLRQVC